MRCFERTKQNLPGRARRDAGGLSSSSASTRPRRRSRTVLGTIPAETRPPDPPRAHEPLQEDRLRGRVQLEGLRGQLPRGVPPPDRPSRSSSRSSTTAPTRSRPPQYYSKQHAPIRVEERGPALPPQPAGGAEPEAPVLLDLPEHDAQPLPRQPADERHPAARPRPHAHALRVVRRSSPTAREWPRSSQQSFAFSDQVQQEDIADLRGRPEGPALAHVRPRPVLRPARERPAPLPRAADEGPEGRARCRRGGACPARAAQGPPLHARRRLRSC